MTSGSSRVLVIARHLFMLAISLCVGLSSAQAYGTRVAGGSNGTRAVKADGTLWSWGDNTYGEVGDGSHGTSLSVRTPRQIGVATNWRAVSSGENHTLALRSDGSIWAWGRNLSGEVGVGDKAIHDSPVRIGTANDWRWISTGRNASYAIKDDGTLWAWGSDFNDTLGNGTGINATEPVRVGTAANWRAVAGGLEHTIGLRTDGTLWAWGRNTFYGALGNGTNSSKSTPIRIGTDADWIAIAAAEHTLAIKRDGSLWGWGRNDSGQAGVGTTAAAVLSPTRIGTDSNWVGISAGIRHSIARKADGTLWTWGWNTYGALGTGVPLSTIATTPVRMGSDPSWQPFAAGWYQNVAIQADGELYVWGDGSADQIGDGSHTNQPLPVLIGNWGAPQLTGSLKYAREFYLAERDIFFRTADNVEANAVASGAAGPWVETLMRFPVGGTEQICRFYGNTNTNPATGTIYGPASHFYTIDAAECNGLKAQYSATAKSWHFESFDYYAMPLGADKTCPVGMQVVYRAYNQGFPVKDSNHRYDTVRTNVIALAAQGWRDEGPVFCVPEQ